MKIEVTGKQAVKLSKMFYPVVTDFALAHVGKGRNRRLVFVQLEIKDVVAWKRAVKQEAKP